MARGLGGILGGIGIGIGGLVNNAINQMNKPNKPSGTTNKPITGGGGSFGSSYNKPSSSGGYNNPYESMKDDYGKTDWSVYLNNGMTSGTMTADDAQRALNERRNKAYDMGYSQYLGDDIEKNTLAYINQKRRDEQYEKDMNKYMGMQDDASAAERAAIDAYIKQSVTGLEGQKAGVAQSADEAARQAYIAYMQSQAALPQALAASGYSGGMADSQKLALSTTLQNNQQDILQNRDNALNDINAAIQKTKLEGSIQGAQSQAQIGRDSMNAYLNYINQKNSQANQDYWNKYGYDFQGGQAEIDRNHQNSMQQGNQNWQSGESDKDREASIQQKRRDDVMNLLLGGAMPTDDMLAAVGMDKNTAQVWLNYGRQQTGKQYGGGTSYGGNTGGSSDIDQTNPGGNKTLPGVTQTQYDQAADRFDGGDYSQEVIDILLSAGNNPAQIAKAAGFGGLNALGMGPVSDAFLAQMVAEGKVEAINIGGTLFYRRAEAPASGANSNQGWPGFRP